MPSAWDALVDHSMDSLRARQARLSDAFSLGTWERYDYDQDAGTLTFSSGGQPRVVASMNVVGSTATATGTWLWSWDNDSILPQVSHCMHRVREYGEAHGHDKLVTAKWPGDERDGWEMAAIAALLLEAEGAYRAPSERGALFMIMTCVRWLEEV
jgi:hypothetical protein